MTCHSGSDLLSFVVYGINRLVHILISLECLCASTVRLGDSIMPRFVYFLQV